MKYLFLICILLFYTSKNEIALENSNVDRMTFNFILFNQIWEVDNPLLDHLEFTVSCLNTICLDHQTNFEFESNFGLNHEPGKINVKIIEGQNPHWDGNFIVVSEKDAKNPGVLYHELLHKEMDSYEHMLSSGVIKTIGSSYYKKDCKLKPKYDWCFNLMAQEKFTPLSFLIGDAQRRWINQGYRDCSCKIPGKYLKCKGKNFTHKYPEDFANQTYNPQTCQVITNCNFSDPLLEIHLQEVLNNTEFEDSFEYNTYLTLIKIACKVFKALNIQSIEQLKKNINRVLQIINLDLNSINEFQNVKLLEIQILNLWNLTYYVNNLYKIENDKEYQNLLELEAKYFQKDIKNAKFLNNVDDYKKYKKEIYKANLHSYRIAFLKGVKNSKIIKN